MSIPKIGFSLSSCPPSAVRAIFGPKIDRATEAGQDLSPDTVDAIAHTRAEYEKQLDATYAAARGFVDAIIVPEETREVLDLAMRCALENPAPHVGTFTLRDDA